MAFAQTEIALDAKASQFRLPATDGRTLPPPSLMR